MAKILADGLLCCVDCTLIIANDDASGLDYHYGDEAEAREKEIREGIAGLGGYAVVGEPYGFSWKGCDCCGSDLGGDKYELAVLGD